ncbi:MAG: hypothetical protein AAGJ51_00010 [Pseudomonadota bacterium]
MTRRQNLATTLSSFWRNPCFNLGLTNRRRRGLMADTHVTFPFRVIKQSWIIREDLKANPDIIYVFGDNAAREGQRGLARQMRHEPNAHAVSVSWGPFEPFSLSTSEAAVARIEGDLIALLERQPTVIIWPLAGIVPEFQSMPAELRLHLRREVQVRLGIDTPI